jgi:hypothetical protein
MLKLVKLPKDNNSRATVLVERPQDPLDYRADDEELHKGYGFPTFLQWPETLHMVENCNLTTVKVDQGSLGHPTTKPTTLLTDIKAINQRGRWMEDARPT